MNNTMTLMTTPATGLAWCPAATHPAHTAPDAGAQGTGPSFAGIDAFAPAAAQVAVYGARALSLPGSPPRGAPV